MTTPTIEKYESGNVKPHVENETGIVDILLNLDVANDVNVGDIRGLKSALAGLGLAVVQLQPVVNLTGQPSSSGAVALSFTDLNIASTGYQVDFRLAGTTTWSTYAASASKSPIQYVTGLTNGVSYEFRVAALSGAVVGPWPTQNAFVTPSSGALASDTFPGSTLDSGKWTTILNGGTVAVTGGKAVLTTDSGDFDYTALLYSGMAPANDIDVIVKAIPLPGPVEQYPTVAINWDGQFDANKLILNGYWLQLSPASNTLEFARVVGGLPGYTILSSPSYTFTSGVPVWVRLVHQGNGLAVYVWNDGGTQPTIPTAAIVDDSTPYTGAGRVGLIGINGTSGSPRAVSFALFTAVSPTASQGSGQSTAPNPSGVAMPTADLTKFKFRAGIDFNTNAPEGSVPSLYTGQLSAYPPGWHDTSGAGDYNWNLLSVVDGALKIHLKTLNGRAQVNAPFMTPGGAAWASQLYGRYAIRYRADTGLTGYKTAWLLWPDSNNWPEGEVDFPEGSLGGNQNGFTHTIGNPSVNSQVYSGSTNYTSAWHTAGIEWTPGRVECFLDNTSVLVDTSGGVPSTPMHWVWQTETDGGVPSSSVDGYVSIDWAALWTYSP